jgi:hypothetical protein
VESETTSATIAQLAFLSRRGFVQLLHRDRHDGVVAPEGATKALSK